MEERSLNEHGTSVSPKISGKNPERRRCEFECVSDFFKLKISLNDLQSDLI